MGSPDPLNENANNVASPIQTHSAAMAYILMLLSAGSGLHRFYCGKPWTGLLQWIFCFIAILGCLMAIITGDLIVMNEASDFAAKNIPAFLYGALSSYGTLILLTPLGIWLAWLMIDIFTMPSTCKKLSKISTSGLKDYNVTWILFLFLGFMGVHRFYMGKIVTGLIWLFSLGFFGVGLIYDIFSLNNQVDRVNMLNQ